ncbi:MAG: ATP synthase F1 subunit delta [Patescibacteria group bacterium]|nr:ATP synthase F1 subunit delta [Patescibacteria group bacterium]
MKFTSQQYAQALYDAVSETNPKDHGLVMDNFAKILAQNGDLGKFPEIEAAYKKIDREAKGIKEAEVTVAREMELNQQIIKELNNAVQASGLSSQLEVKKKVDESIIGGVIVRVNDTLIDASVKNQLENLNKSLKN